VIVVGNDAEAEMACGLLRSSGIECGHRPAEVAQGPWEGLGTSGPREVLVAEGDLEEARRILDAGDTSGL
jgi:Putative prokaryotic signal transducing protein